MNSITQQGRKAIFYNYRKLKLRYSFTFILKLSILICLPFHSWGQTNTCTSSGSEREIFNPCGDILEYAPDPNAPPEHYPIKTVGIIFHVLQDEFGGSNFQNIPAHTDFLRDIVGGGHNSLNGRFGNLCEPDPLLSDHVEDTRIRFEVLDILFHQCPSGDDGCWCVDDGVSPAQSNKRCEIFENFVLLNTPANGLDRQPANHCIHHR